MQNDTYEAPSVTVLGTLEQFTQANQGGNTLDATFPAGTPLNQLTTS